MASLSNFFRELFNRDVVKKYNDAVASHKAAIDEWLKPAKESYAPRFNIPNSELGDFKKHDVELERFFDLGPKQDLLTTDNLSFDQKKYIIEHEKKIVFLYRTYKKYKK